MRNEKEGSGTNCRRRPKNSPSVAHAAATLRSRRDPRGHLGLRQADQGFRHADAVLTAVETRTSPVCIRRDDSLQSVSTRGLYPGGEGAGYAGGILSAAVDGIKVAEAVGAQLLGVAR